MTKSIISLTKKIYAYQKVRFPVIVLALSFLPAIMSSAAVVSLDVSMIQIISALAVSVLYLLHVRIIDEIRDYNHDLMHHRDRPIQSGIISIKELKRIDLAVTILIIGIVIFLGFVSFSIMLIMFLYSYFAGKEFLLVKKLRQNFFLYNFLNILQIFLLQFFVYSIFVTTITFTNVLVLHFIFTAIGTIIFEFLRKLKIPGTDGTGKDTYTWYLGFNNAIFIYISLALINALVFFIILFSMLTSINIWFFIAITFVSLTVLSAFIHKIEKNSFTDGIMKLSFALGYSGFNLIIYFVILF